MASSSPLLSLPREMRDAIYEFVVLGEQPISIKQTLPLQRRRLFTSKSTIILACKQNHNEYFEVLEKTALSAKSEAVIETMVTNFDFSNLIAFTSQLSTAELNAIKSSTKLHVKLSVARPVNAIPRAWVETNTNKFTDRIQRFIQTGVSATYEAGVACTAATMTDKARTYLQLRRQPSMTSEETTKMVVAMRTWYRSWALGNR